MLVLSIAAFGSGQLPTVLLDQPDDLVNFYGPSATAFCPSGAIRCMTDTRVLREPPRCLMVRGIFLEQAGRRGA
jgi:hypothetical protein